MFNKGDFVQVSNDGIEWGERIFIEEIKGAKTPILTVRSGHEILYQFGEKFDIGGYVYVRESSKTQEIEYVSKSKFENLSLLVLDLLKQKRKTDKKIKDLTYICETLSKKFIN